MGCGMAKLLIVEDQNDINEMITKSLTDDGYVCDQAYSGTEALLKIEQGDYDLVVLDLMLPGIDGSEVLKRTHQFSKVPFIILSAHDELDVKVDLLTIGADDYLTKPFALKELKARIMVCLRKNNKEMPGLLTFKELVMNRESHEVKLNSELLNLTQQEFKILELFMMHPDKVFRKQEIYQYAWDEYYIGEDKTINVHISNIRQKIKKISDQDYIETIWGIGFRLNK